MVRSRREGVERRNYVSAMYRLKKFIDKWNGQDLTKKHVSEIHTDLEIVLDKFLKIRSLYPSCNRVDLSDKVWQLLRISGVAPKRLLPRKHAISSF